MVSSLQKLPEKLIWAFIAFVIAIALIQAAFQYVAESMKNTPLWIQIVIAGMLATFVYAMRDTIKKHLKRL